MIWYTGLSQNGHDGQSTVAQQRQFDSARRPTQIQDVLDQEGRQLVKVALALSTPASTIQPNLSHLTVVGSRDQWQKGYIADAGMVGSLNSTFPFGCCITMAQKTSFMY